MTRPIHHTTPSGRLVPCHRLSTYAAFTGRSLAVVKAVVTRKGWTLFEPTDDGDGLVWAGHNNALIGALYQWTDPTNPDPDRYPGDGLARAYDRFEQAEKESRR